MPPFEKGNILSDLVQAMHERRVQPENTLTETCGRPDIGRLVESLGYDFLIQTLELKQSTFASEYPEMASFGEQTRTVMRDVVQEHLQTCQRCKQEAANEATWKEAFLEFVADSNSVVRDILKEKRQNLRDKPRSASASSGSPFS